MQLVLFACLAVVALAAPQNPEYRHIAILRDEREDRGDGNFRYEFETENGIHVNAVGAPGSNGQSNIQGFYRYPLEDGSIAEVTYVADEGGFRPESPLIPAIPEHVYELLRIAEEQRSSGIKFDEQGFRIN
ncbi:cuticle protein AMP4-like isoform X3 [Panulirus ornatus]|uniref:cuticle protein AMP4-like isoform X2 n=1 Tax=Panulirus ornatus TaxID=150431 RepID=UPI003A845C13